MDPGFLSPPECATGDRPGARFLEFFGGESQAGGALVRISVRRIKLAMPSAFPYQAEYRAAHAALA